MKRLIAIAFITGLLFLGVDVSDALLRADVTFTNNTGSAITETGLAFPLSTQGLLNANVIQSDTLDLALVDASDEDVPMMPSPVQTELESCKLDDGGVFSTDTTDCNDSSTNDVDLLPVTPVVDDAFYFGAHWPFRILRTLISQNHSATGTAMVVAWEYCTDNTCSTTSAVDGLVDETDAFRNSGTKTVSFDMPDDWDEATVDGVLAYWLRARVTTAPTGTLQQPKATQVWWDRGIAQAMPCSTCDADDVSIVAQSLGDGESVAYRMFTGQSDDIASHVYFPGDTGATVADNATLELGNDDYNLGIFGYFNTDQTGSTRSLIEKGAAVDISWNSASNGQLDVAIDHGTDDCDLNHTGISTGWHVITVRLFSGTCTLRIDAVDEDTDTASGSVLNIGDSWVFGGEDSAVYMDEWAINADNSAFGVGSSEVHYQMDETFTGIAITDQAANAPDIDAVPSFDDPSTNIGQISAFESVQIVEGTPAEAQAPDLLGDVSAPEFAGTPISGTTLPGGEAVDALAQEANLPSSVFWLMLGFIVSISILALSFRFTQNIVLSMLFAGFAMMIFTTMGFFEVWQVFVFAVVGAVVVFVGARFTINA